MSEPAALGRNVIFKVNHSCDSRAAESVISVWRRWHRSQHPCVCACVCTASPGWRGTSWRVTSRVSVVGKTATFERVQTTGNDT